MIQVSVIIPIYNIERHLPQCLDSIIHQSIEEIEIICVDDASTDSSPGILTKYATRDKRIRVINQQTNTGPGAARNAGLTIASGTYVIFLDSDDWFEADFLESMVRRATETDADVTICRAVEFDTQTEKELPSEWMLKTQYLPAESFSPIEIRDYIFQFTYGMAWDKLYRRVFLQQTGLSFPPLRNSEDLAFVFPSLLAAKRIAVLDSILVHHRVNRFTSVSNTRSSQPQAPYEAFNIVKDFLEEQGLEETYRRSFLNWAMEFLVWHVSNMDDEDVRRDYYMRLRAYWLPSVGFEKYPVSYYYSRFSYVKYLLAKYAPYSIFITVVKIYKRQKRLLEKRR